MSNRKSKPMNTPGIRLATLDQLLATVIAAHFDPPPSKRTLREWLDRAGVRRFKQNQDARRGGGQVHYVASDVEKMIATRTIRRTYRAPVAA